MPHGDRMCRAVENQLAPWLPRVFGYHLLKLGALSAQVSTLNCSVSRHYNIFEQPIGEHVNANMLADIHHLPIQAKSADALMSVFNLEYEDDPYQLLREMDRVLISGGYLFIVGFNPVSPLFIGKLLPQYQPQFPWCGQFFMPSRIKDWLGLLGFQIQSDERFFYDTLLTDKSSIKKLQNNLSHWLPNAGSIYLIVARKIETPLTKITAKQKSKNKNWSTAPTAGRTGVSRQ
ncbi:class I SAM-dependent methyltransferase [Shewanella maritima]|uniref:class I SAM-dependent methyltransferase n=1 Tax=Shewanella maritima TaxID=2520507 RepID=UPI003735A728